MTRCPSCATELPQGSRFCLRCGASLASPAAVAEERKVVTTLFCDLVDFTAMTEQTDPEDVDAVLRRYHAVAREVIEAHGGTVEKFIGDAVVGAFGVPAAHEDDPERAVRAGLRLVASLRAIRRPDGSPLAVRVGVDTGEALVRLDVDPLSGRGFLVGDAVNTAARLQSAASPGQVVVGGSTRDLASRAIMFEELPRVSAKGKAETLAAWVACAQAAEDSTAADDGGLSPLVGRGEDVARLVALFERAARSSVPQFALVVGEPGIGKSRLIQEFAGAIDVRGGPVTRGTGHCLPYGESSPFSSLAQIVRTHAGIPEATSATAARSRLEAVVDDGPERDWLLDRLCALLGLEAPPASREENFAGWTRFLESLAASGPAVLVFEDLHWADEALLEFLDHFAAHASAVPLLVLACSRPELWEAHPAFAPGARFDRISMRPLSRAETASLVAELLGERDAGAGAEIVARCGGNPFFAEQSVRFIADAFDVRALPGSVQAVIAARIDALPPEHKALVADAAVVGAVFWDRVLAEIAGRDLAEVEGAVRDLVARQFFQPVAHPATKLTGAGEFAFVHALAREVAYRQLPRAARAHKHMVTARWLESLTRDRPLDLSETLAHHYSTARELAEAAGEQALADRLREPAAKYLKLAGDRASTLDVGAAGKYYEAALGLVPESDPLAAQLELGLGVVRLWSGEGEAASDHLTRAAESLRETGEVRSAAVALVRLARARHSLSADPREVDDLYGAAIGLLEGDAPSPELLSVLTEWGRRLVERNQHDAAVETFERAIAIARDMGGPEPALALCLRGVVRAFTGDPRYLDDYRRAMAAAEDQGLSIDRARVWLNFAYDVGLTAGPQRSLEEYDGALSFASQRGLTSMVLYGRAVRVEPLVYAGRWEDALGEMDDLESVFAGAAGDSSELLWGRRLVLLPLLWRGRVDETRRRLERAQVQSDAAAPAGDAPLAAVVGAIARSWLRLSEPGAEPGPRVTIPINDNIEWLAFLIPEAIRLSCHDGDAELAERLCRRVGGSLPAGTIALACAAALRAEARGDDETAAQGFAAAAEAWRGFGVPYEEGHAHFGRARCLNKLGRASEAAASLAAAREIFARLDARPALAETVEALSRL